MLNEKMITNIRSCGIMQGANQVDERMRILTREMGFRMTEKAENVLIASCFNPFIASEDMANFRKLLDHFKIDYTLLQKEYCCGDPLYIDALKEGKKEEIKECDSLSSEFVNHNLEQIDEIGASRIIAYCAGCDLVFERLKGSIKQEVVWHPTLLAQLFKGGKLDLKADYYAGCHRIRRTLNNTTPDLDSVMSILNSIEGLELNHLNHKLCCMEAKQLEPLASSVKNKTIITPCTGCAMYLKKALKGKGDYRIILPSTLIWEIIDGQKH